MQRLKLFAIIAAVFILISLVFSYHAFYLDSVSDSEVTVEIPRGYGLNSIAALLERKGIVRSKDTFRAFVFLGGFSNNLKAGEYVFDPGVTISDISEKLKSGDVVQYKVTIPEGFNIYEIADALEKNRVVSKKDFLSLAFSTEYITENLNLEVESLEGFLFPDTYSFNKNEEPQIVIDTMLDRFMEIYGSIEGTEKMGILETVIRASIIEKETGVNHEKPLISAVIDNRLKKGYRLECDPTVIYGVWSEFDGNLTKKDLQSDSPYNTYRIRGLPPGPIANPGKESIEAALNPADVDYLYFVSRGDGSHVFSTTYRNHVNAVNRYQR